MMASLFEQFTGTGMLDDVEVALGQTVPVRLPMTVPVAELGNMEIEIIMYYTLNSIENGLGNFGIGMDMQMSMEIQESLVTVTAKGDGRMVYDIAGEYTPYSDIDMTMNFNIPVEKGGVDEEFVNSGRYEIEVACRRFPAQVSLIPLYDPDSSKIKM